MMEQLVEVGKDHTFEDRDIKCASRTPHNPVISIQFYDLQGNVFFSKEDVKMLAEDFGFTVTEKEE